MKKLYFIYECMSKTKNYRFEEVEVAEGIESDDLEEQLGLDNWESYFEVTVTKENLSTFEELVGMMKYQLIVQSNKE